MVYIFHVYYLQICFLLKLYYLFLFFYKILLEHIYD
nr:MAG TPA: hypothetical protein [Caudoviricetes sp.]